MTQLSVFVDKPISNNWFLTQFLFQSNPYTGNLWYLLYYSPTPSARASMHVCISLSCDWLSDFLKGYRATISFWHLITVRSHCAPADPFWYGPCTCPSPLSQVPIIIIKTLLPPRLHLQPQHPSLPQPLWVHSSCTEEEEFNLGPVWAIGHILWPLLALFGSFIYHLLFWHIFLNEET